MLTAYPRKTHIRVSLGLLGEILGRSMTDSGMNGFDLRVPLILRDRHNAVTT